MSRSLLCLLATLFSCVSLAQVNVKLSEKESLSVQIPGKLIFQHPKGDKGWYHKGLNQENDGTYDVRSYYGIKMKIKNPTDERIEIRCCLYRAKYNEDRHNLPDSTVAVLQVAGKGWQDIMIPIESFDFNRGQEYFLKFIERVTVDFSCANVTGQKVEIKAPCLVKAHTLLLESKVRSMPLNDNGEAIFQVMVTNTSDIPQAVTLQIKRNGWEGMQSEVTPSSLFLDSGEMSNITVKVKGNEYIPAGAHESIFLQAIPFMKGGKTEEFELIPVVPVASPFIIHNATEWEKIKEKIKKYEWAKKDWQGYIQTAEAFQVPVVKKGTMSDQNTEGLVRAYIEHSLHQTAIAYYLTGNRTYGEKVAETLRRLTDPVLGYPRTNHLTFQGIPQEGGTMEGLLFAYDLIKNSGLLSEEECRNVEYTFRLFCENFIDMMGDGGISNWSVFNLGPAAECALLLHDMYLFNKIAYGPCGLIDHLRYGMLDDGWWYEMSLSYNIGTAVCYTTTALAARPFGIDWINQKFPASLTRKVGLRPFEFENLLGMGFGKFGPLKHNYVDIKRMWDAILVYPDYRGVMFGMGDGHEQVLAGNQFEMAYYVFRDPRYVSVLKRSDKRGLLYGVEELPEDTLNLYKRSGYSDNAGIAVLRTQTKDREDREQIQIAMKYGTHGSYHGHFDRISFLSLMRYGRSFYNPETSWFGYGSYMYKWWTQATMSHNMVVVDGMMQEPTTCNQLLYHSGQMAQALVVETDAKWSNPPYLGGYDQIEAIKKGDKPYIPIPENAPIPGELGEYSEPVHQRRLALLMDDYVLLADYLEGEKNHLYENLLQLRGIYAKDGMKMTGGSRQWDSNPLSSGQFITSVKNYDYQKGAMIHSVHRFASKGKDGKNMQMNNWETGGQNQMYNEPGNLYMDVHYLWPSEGQLRIGDYAECWNNERKFKYTVEADGEVLNTDSLQAWLLGTCKFKVDLSGKKELTIKVKAKITGWQRKSLMLVDAVLKNSEGINIPLSSLKVLQQNLISLPDETKDYDGGPIKIAGTAYDKAIGVEPENGDEYAVLKYDLSGLDIVSLEGILGCDYFNGNEEQIRKTIGVQHTGENARFLTLIEPYEQESVIKEVKVLSEYQIEVSLKNGMKQIIVFENFYKRCKDVEIKVEEWKDGQMIRSEIMK